MHTYPPEVINMKRNHPTHKQSSSVYVSVYRMPLCLQFSLYNPFKPLQYVISAFVNAATNHRIHLVIRISESRHINPLCLSPSHPIRKPKCKPSRSYLSLSTYRSLSLSPSDPSNWTATINYQLHTVYSVYCFP